MPQPATRQDMSNAENLSNQITELCGYINVATYQLLVMIAEFDRKKYWALEGFQSCAHWLNVHCGFGLGSARERIRIAHALCRLPKIAKHFSTGELSYSKVRAVTRVANETNEEHLLNFALYGTAHQVDRIVSQYRRLGRFQDEDEVCRQYVERAVSYYYDEVGSLVMKVKMPAAEGEMLVKALEKMMEADRAECPDVPAGTSEDTDDTETPIPENRTAARRADALAHIAQTYLNGDGKTGSAADRYQVVVHVSNDDAMPAQIENGPHVPAGTSRRVACDCSTVTIVENDKGEPLSIGRRSRTIPPSIKRALVARDGGCRFPGCTNQRFVVGHHIKHWADGGETSLDNLVLLCEHHHHLVHEGGFDCRKSEGNEIYFVDTRNEPLGNISRPRPISIENSLNWMRRRFAHARVTPETCISGPGAGERLNWKLVQLQL